MKMRVTIEQDEVKRILNEAISKAVGQSMTARGFYVGDIEFESEELATERVARVAQMTSSVIPIDEAVEDRPRLTTEGSAAAAEVEEEVSL